MPQRVYQSGCIEQISDIHGRLTVAPKSKQFEALSSWQFFGGYRSAGSSGRASVGGFPKAVV
jgi:hypothetical protein